MEHDDHRLYYARRQQEEEVRARSCDDPAVALVHAQFGALYGERLRGLEQRTDDGRQAPGARRHAGRLID